MKPEIVESVVPVTKEAHELAVGIENFLYKMKDALSDGWQTDQDLPPVLQGALGDLIPGLQGAEKFGNEAKGAPVHFGAAFATMGLRVGESFAPAHDPEATEEAAAPSEGAQSGRKKGPTV